jgi:hypothetical protein
MSLWWFLILEQHEGWSSCLVAGADGMEKNAVPDKGVFFYSVCFAGKVFTFQLFGKS